MNFTKLGAVQWTAYLADVNKIIVDRCKLLPADAYECRHLFTSGIHVDTAVKIILRGRLNARRIEEERKADKAKRDQQWKDRIDATE